MTILFYVFLILVVFHFIWEGIIAPSLRLELRYELFRLRDSLRNLKIQNNDALKNELFDTLQHVINGGIALLHRATIGDFYRAYKTYGNKESVQLNFEKVQKLVNECPIEEIRNIWDKTGLIAVGALIVNSGGWLIYVVPILFVILTFGTLKMLATKLLVGLSDNDLNTLFPAKPRIVSVS